MKKLNKVLAILCTSAVAVSVGAFAGCTKPDDGGTHTHSYNYTKVDDTNHKGECKVDGCDAPEITEAHNWGTDNKCDKCDAVKPTPVTVTKVEISGKTEAKVGEEVQLTATVTGTGNPAKTVTWTKVSGEGAVSADGKVTATAAGEVKVKATSTVDTTKSAEHTVTFAAAEVSLTLADSYVCVDDSGETTAEVTVNYDGEGTVTATSKNAEVATAAYAEGKITVTAVKTGRAVIEVTDGEKKAELTVEVATAGLTYETLGAEDAEGNAYEYVQVSDGEGRTSTDVYIPGYRYMEDAAEGEGALLPVTIIKDQGFKGANIVTVFTGDNVIKIGEKAFAGEGNNKNTHLVTVNAGKALKNVGIRAFSYCSTLTTFNWAEGAIAEVVDQAAFERSGLTSFVFPETITGVNSGMFYECTALKSIKFQGEFTTIIGGTCQNGIGLEELWIPASVTVIEGLAFYTYAEADQDLTVHFAGTREQWNSISIAESNNLLLANKNSKLIVICADDAAE